MNDTKLINTKEMNDAEALGTTIFSFDSAKIKLANLGVPFAIIYSINTLLHGIMATMWSQFVVEASIGKGEEVKNCQALQLTLNKQMQQQLADVLDISKQIHDQLKNERSKEMH